MRYLEDELADLLQVLRLQDRQVKAVAARLGWDGRGTCTLAVAATAEGYSRERVRQLEERVRAKAVGVGTRVTTTVTALELIEDLAPIAIEEVGFELRLAGLSLRPFHVSGLLSAADVLEIDHSLAAEGGMLHVAETFAQELAA
jgi:hypothetical protein